MSALPIDAVLPSLVEALRRCRSLVLEAPPGAGKTTRVPVALLEAGFADEGEILVLQPRRLPTRVAASRVAQNLGEEVGARVGYQMRFESVGGPRTKIRFLTEGTLTRRLLSDPSLTGVSMVILDELHERHLVTDLSLALLRHMQQTTRPDLRLLAMSATLDGERVAAYLGADQVLRSEGRAYPVEIEHLERPDERPLHLRVAGAVKRLLQRDLDGHVLVFLPGAGEIQRAGQALAEVAASQDLLVLPLHGALPPAQQDRALAPSPKRKIILSTNVAETSLTIDGVAAVIDSGLARIPGYAATSGLPSLELGTISQASATQRAGRAGRTRAGLALRLYTKQDFLARPAHDTPELLRADLAQTLLTLYGIGAEPTSLSWLDPPPAQALAGAEALLDRLGASRGNQLTETGERLLALPVHPRLGRWIVEGEALGVADDACLLAALASERDLRSRSSLAGSQRAGTSGPSDLLELLELFRQAERGRFNGLDPRGVDTVRRVYQQLRRHVKGANRLRGAEAEEALLQVILKGFPDRVAKRRSERGRELLLSQGGTATLAQESVVREAPFLVSVEAEQGGRGTLVRLASQVEPEWLLDQEEIDERDELVWNQESGRVERWSRIVYGSITLVEDRHPAPPSEEAAAILAKEMLSRGIHSFLPQDVWADFEARYALAVSHLGFPPLEEAQVAEALQASVLGLRSLDEARRADLFPTLVGALLGERRAALDRALPSTVTLPSGRRIRIHYQAGAPPWIASRLQDFFGMEQGPTILGGRLPLTLHLLAPNQRAVQVTQDLQGFWTTHYPTLRRQLSRRYPKHAWPEDGATASPPPPRSPRRR